MSDFSQERESGGASEGGGSPGLLEYPLLEKAIDHWLLAGPVAVSLNKSAPWAGGKMNAGSGPDNGGQSLFLHSAREKCSFYPRATAGSEGNSGASDPPVFDGWRLDSTGAPAERETFLIGEDELTWRAYHCLEDHLIDLGAFHATWHYAQAWAYCELECGTAQQVEFVFKLFGAAEVWLNERPLMRHEQFRRPGAIAVQAHLEAGHNRVLARLDTVTRGQNPQRFGMSLADVPGESLTVCLPTSIEPLGRRSELEQLFHKASLDRYVYTAEDKLVVAWPDEVDRPEGGSKSDMEMRVQTAEGRIYMMARSPFPDSEGTTTIDLGTALRAPEGACELQVMPGPEEYTLGGMRIRRKLRLHVVKNAFSDQPAEQGTYPQRRVEALLDATRRQGMLFSEIARMALERWAQVREEVLQQTVADLMLGSAEGGCNVVGLVGMLARFGDNSSFPKALKMTLEECVCGFPFWLEGRRGNETGQWGESQQILLFAAQIIAGQLFPKRSFTDGQSGQKYREEGERGAIAWCRSRGSYGFLEWDSCEKIEANVVALVHLVDLAENDDVRELAAVILDKMFFGMALNSYRGVYGSTQGRADSLSIRSARLAATSGISRLLWGMGVYNEHVMGSVSLACSDIYFLPPIIEAIAGDFQGPLISRERSRAANGGAGELNETAREVNRVTFRSADGMLSSAQDYRPGEPGGREHIWQATLGTDAVVFVNQPACMSEEEAHSPNCWRGNATLPRVVQWRDMLIAVHKCDERHGMPAFTHGHFPTYAFDEYRLEERWAFASKGDGYIALAAANGLSLTEQGQQAYRELRSSGGENIWLCHLGRREEDGSFAEFRRKVNALEVEFGPLSVRCATLRGETLALGWTGPLLVDGEEQSIGGFRHYENRYCEVDLGATQMEVVRGEDAIRLHFS